MDIIVRKAELKDLDTMVELMNHLLTTEGGLPIVKERLEKGISMIIKSDISDFFVAESEGEVLGMACLHRFISSVQGGYVGVVEDVVVFDEHTGQGIASSLMAFMEEYAKSTGLSRLQLQVLRDNEPAIALYEKHGWEDTRYTGFRKYL